MNRAALLAALGFLLLVAVPVGSACHSQSAIPVPPAGQVPNYNFGEDFGYRLYLKADGAKGILSPISDARTQATLTKGDATSGVLAGVAAIQGNRYPDTMEFEMETGLETTLWFNLSKPIIGVLRLSSTLGQASNGRDDTLYRIRLFAGDRYIAGDDCNFTPLTAAWNNAPLKMRPETDKLPAGQKLRLQIVRMGGLSDFQVGTHAPQQSFIELRVTSYDLAASAVLLRNHRLFYGAPDGNAPASSPDEEAAKSAPRGQMLLLAAPLLLLPRRGRNQRLAALLAVALLVGGCLGGGGAPKDRIGAEGTDDSPKPTIRTTSAPDPTLEGVQAGSVAGYVRSDLGIPLKDAHVAIVGTPNFTITDGRGFYLLPWVAKGTYRFHADRDTFQPVEQMITIQAGHRLTLNVTMVPINDRGANLREHRHGAWESGDTVPLWTTDFTLRNQQTALNDQPLPPDTDPDVCAYSHPCAAPIPLPDQRPVPPGTGMVEVVMTWTKTALPVDEIGLTFSNSKNYFSEQGSSFWHEKTLMPRASGVPFLIYVFPDEADSGHQTDTDWSFTAWAWSTRHNYVPFAPPLRLGGTIHVEMKAHKGVVVPEPPHTDFWDNLTEKILLVDVKKQITCIGCDYPYQGSANQHWYFNDWKSLIPIGTKEIIGSFRWENPYDAPAGPAWGLAYKTGASPYGSQTSPGEMKRVQATASGNRIDFVLRPEAKDLDPFYAANSGWAFYPDDLNDPIGTTKVSPNGALLGGVDMFLSLRIVKDPAYRLE